MAPDNYIAIVRASFDAAMGFPQAAPSEREPDELGNRVWRFLGVNDHAVEVSIHPSGIVECEWEPLLKQSQEDVREAGARVLGERIARFFNGDDTAAEGPSF